ncbi:MAG: hypothetical protein EOO89_23600 [Pedobacter sp.]|nr:MAG: hypothetical protein EOO89_23600 [Pedobacter sp.]
MVVPPPPVDNNSKLAVPPPPTTPRKAKLNKLEGSLAPTVTGNEVINIKLKPLTTVKLASTSLSGTVNGSTVQHVNSSTVQHLQGTSVTHLTSQVAGVHALTIQAVGPTSGAPVGTLKTINGVQIQAIPSTTGPVEGNPANMKVQGVLIPSVKQN